MIEILRLRWTLRWTPRTKDRKDARRCSWSSQSLWSAVISDFLHVVTFTSSLVVFTNMGFRSFALRASFFKIVESSSSLFLSSSRDSRKSAMSLWNVVIILRCCSSWSSFASSFFFFPLLLLLLTRFLISSVESIQSEVYPTNYLFPVLIRNVLLRIESPICVLLRPRVHPWYIDHALIFEFQTLSTPAQLCPEVLVWNNTDEEVLVAHAIVYVPTLFRVVVSEMYLLLHTKFTIVILKEIFKHQRYVRVDGISSIIVLVRLRSSVRDTRCNAFPYPFLNVLRFSIASLRRSSKCSIHKTPNRSKLFDFQSFVLGNCACSSTTRLVAITSFLSILQEVLPCCIFRIRLVDSAIFIIDRSLSLRNDGPEHEFQITM